MDEVAITSTDEDALARVTVVTVTYNSARLVAGSLATVASAGRIIVVDNASADDTVTVVRAAMPAAEVIANPENLGYGGGANLGLDRVTSEFALLLTPDVVVAPGCVAGLVAVADAHSDAGLVVPQLRTEADEVETSHDAGLFDRTGMARRRDGEASPEGVCCAGYVSGAVVLARMSALRDVGFYDPAIFLFFEDDDICLRLTRAGYPLLLAPAARATHLAGTSSVSGARFLWLRYFHFAWSRIYIEAKYRGRAAAWAVGVPSLVMFPFKAAANSVIGQRAKALRDAARFSGTLMALVGRPSRRTLARGRR